MFNLKKRNKSLMIVFRFCFACVVFIGFIYLSGCGDESTEVGNSNDIDNYTADVYPMITDDNSNRINDYIEEDTHYSGFEPEILVSISNFIFSLESAFAAISPGAGLCDHDFVDSDDDGICDYAQNGSNTWHGPGFVDGNNNGVCDYWDEDHRRYNKNKGMMFHDQNRNLINDNCEQQWHNKKGHSYVDSDSDEICDYAQDGSATWHGPNFEDEDGDGVCDHWQSGGRGHGNRNSRKE